MKVALIVPRSVAFFDREEDREIADIMLRMSNAFRLIGTFKGALPLLAGLLPEDVECRIIDDTFEEIDFDEDFDLVAITAMTTQALRGYAIADEFRKRGVHVVMGGIHLTLVPEEASSHADTVIVGEAEETWPVFFDDFRHGRPERCYRADGPADLTRSPLPRFELLDVRYNMPTVQTTRGCPYDCDFCAATRIFGRGFRHKTVEQIVREVQAVKQVWGATPIYFTDDNMCVNRKFTRDLLRELIPLEVTWNTSTDVSVAHDDELLELMAESGCTLLFFGFESMSEEGLASVSEWKRKRLDEYPKVVEKVRSYGIEIFASFIVGLDGDDVSVFPRIGDFICQNDIYRFFIPILTPFPGTKVRERLISENRLLDTDWDHYNQWEVNFIPKRMTVDELRTAHRELHRRLYTPEVVAKMRKAIREFYGAALRKTVT